MASLCDYIVDAAPAAFEENEFQDSTLFKEWLLRDRENCVSSSGTDNYQFIYAIVQEMSQLRFRAEENFRLHPHIARNKLRELPVPQAEIIEKFMGVDERKEPPETVISRIAQNQISSIDAVLANVRKVLRRKRELTRLASVQQLDSQCLIWLTRQPGFTAAQKAGSKQKLMAIVRTESCDVLENRVLKAVLELCLSFCRRYLLQYEEAHPNSSRIKAVIRLQSTAQKGICLESLRNIPPQTGIPQPNYVLLHDPQYSQIWRMYLNLLQQTALMESAWRNRHNLFRQYLLFCLVTAIHLECDRMIFSSDFRFSTEIRRDGLFIKNSSFQRVFTMDGKPYQFEPVDFSRLCCQSTREIHTAEIRSRRQSHRISAVYLPLFLQPEEIQFPVAMDNHTYFIYSEHPATSFLTRPDIVKLEATQELTFQVSDWLASFRKSMT